jgi:GTPase SAR1 family protein
VPIILVGLKSDLRNNQTASQNLISPMKGEEVSARIGAFHYAECSALSNEGIVQVFEQAARAVKQKERISLWRKLFCLA